MKNNLGQDGNGFKFTVEEAEVQGCRTIRLLWGDVVEGDAFDIFKGLQPADQRGGKSHEQHSVEEWLRWVLTTSGGSPQGGENSLLRADVLAAGAAAGFSESAIDRARQRLPISSRKGYQGKAVWTWHEPAVGGTTGLF